MPNSEPEWVSLNRAKVELAIGQSGLNQLLADGRLSIRRVPGSQPRVRLSDVRRVATTFTKEATTVGA